MELQAAFLFARERVSHCPLKYIHKQSDGWGIENGYFAGINFILKKAAFNRIGHILIILMKLFVNTGEYFAVAVDVGVTKRTDRREVVNTQIGQLIFQEQKAFA